MSDVTKLTTEIVNMRSDILYLVRLVEKLETKIKQLENKIEESKSKDPLAGKIIEKL